MKAKRIAEIAHEIVQLRAEMDALSAELKDEYGKCAAHLIAKAIIENTLKAIPFATAAAAASSDRMRAELTANNIEMNRLTERNDAILSTLRGRGLEPVSASNITGYKGFESIPVEFKNDIALMPDEILVGNTIRRKSETPLTNEQLRAGGWWCDRTGGNRGALRRKNIDYVECQDTDGNYVFYEASCNSDVKEIIRKGNEFYYV